MRVAVLATGGKDSTLAIYHVQNEGHKVACLASIIPLKEASWMFHYPNIRMVDLFAEAVKIPLFKAETSGNAEKEIEDLKRLIATLDVEGIVSGAIASVYQKTRIEEICRQLRLQCLTPLWKRDPLTILEEILSLGFHVIVTGVYAHGFNAKWLGRKIDRAAVQDLIRLNERYGVSVVGEGGEYETLVLDAPMFKKRIRILEAENVWKDPSGFYLVKKAALENK